MDNHIYLTPQPYIRTRTYNSYHTPDINPNDSNNNIVNHNIPRTITPTQNSQNVVLQYVTPITPSTPVPNYSPHTPENEFLKNRSNTNVNLNGIFRSLDNGNHKNHSNEWFLILDDGIQVRATNNIQGGFNFFFSLFIPKQAPSQIHLNIRDTSYIIKIDRKYRWTSFLNINGHPVRLDDVGLMVVVYKSLREKGLSHFSHYTDEKVLNNKKNDLYLQYVKKGLNNNCRSIFLKFCYTTLDYIVEAFKKFNTK